MRYLALFVFSRRSDTTPPLPNCTKFVEVGVFEESQVWKALVSFTDQYHNPKNQNVYIIDQTKITTSIIRSTFLPKWLKGSPKKGKSYRFYCSCLTKGLLPFCFELSQLVVFHLNCTYEYHSSALKVGAQHGCSFPQPCKSSYSANQNACSLKTKQANSC